MANCFFSLPEMPSSFLSSRNRAGLFLNRRFTCVAECLDRCVMLWLEALLPIMMSAVTVAAIRIGDGAVATLTTNMMESYRRRDRTQLTRQQARERTAKYCDMVASSGSWSRAQRRVCYGYYDVVVCCRGERFPSFGSIPSFSDRFWFFQIRFN